MRTIVNKLFFGAIFLFLSWKGLDGLIDNIFFNSTASYDILEVEKMEDVGGKYLEIKYGLAYTEDLLYYEEDVYSPVDIFYLLLSNKQQEQFNSQEAITVKVVVRINDKERRCLDDLFCLPSDSVNISGKISSTKEVRKVKEDLQLLETELVKFDDDLIVIEAGEKPFLWYWNLLFFIIGAVFGITIIKSFFQKATGFKDYWDKVTEKGKM